MPSVDFSVSGIFLQASDVVQAVLVLLGLASVVCWAIILEKTMLLFGLRRQLGILERVARADIRPARKGKRGGLAQLIVDEGRGEWAVEKTGESLTNRRERTERAMRDRMASELIRSENRLHYLATIASSAPFVGLFGTVWGIMHAFAGIAQANDTSLATVAPGISEALSTTAIGLVAAIPASIAYNKLASDFGTVARRLSLAISAMARRVDDIGERQAAE